MTSTQGSRSVQVKICGDVHGKAFRLWTEKNAEMLGLAGWVRNRCDGSVEAMFSGPKDIVDEMISRCSEGPPGAKVDEVNVLREECGQFSDEFDVLPTA